MTVGATAQANGQPSSVHSPQAERRLLGAFLVGQAIPDDLQARLFHDDGYRNLFEAIRAVAKTGAITEPVKVAENIRAEVGHAAWGSDVSELLGVANDACYPHEVSHFVEMLKAHAVRRDVIAACSDIQAQARNGTGPDELLQEARARIEVVGARAGVVPVCTVPMELPDGVPAVAGFDDRLLPESFRPWLGDVNDRTQCPPEFSAVAAIVSAGAVIGRSCGVRPKRFDDWTVTPNLWGAAVGPPSSMKSPAIQEGMRPLSRLVAKETERFKEESRRRDFEVVTSQVQVKEILRDVAKAKSDEERAALRGDYEEAVAASSPPIEKRYMLNDTTVEKLGEILNANPRGVLVFRDELSGWLATLDRDGHENDRAFYLEGYNGLGRYTYDRIGRGTIHVGAVCLSLIGGIQPGPLARYLRDGLRGAGGGDDGLVQRLQLLVYPDMPHAWRNVDRWPNTAARDRAFEIYERLDDITGEVIGAEADPDPNGVPFLRFAPAAQEFFNSWIADLMCRLRSGDEHSAMEAHLGKYPALLPKLALVFHMIDTVQASPGPIALVAAQRAAAWCDLLETHARRMYHAVTAEKIRAARTLLAKLRSGKLSTPFSSRDVQRASWSGLSERESVEEALATLEEFGWVTKAIVPTDGRPRTEWHAHPSIAAQRSAA